MPLITLEGPSLSVERKRELAMRFTELASELYRIDKRHITVLI